MFDEYVMAILEMQYQSIQELMDKLGRFPTRDEVVNHIEAQLTETKKAHLRLV